MPPQPVGPPGAPASSAQGDDLADPRVLVAALAGPEVALLRLRSGEEIDASLAAHLLLTGLQARQLTARVSSQSAPSGLHPQDLAHSQ